MTIETIESYYDLREKISKYVPTIDPVPFWKMIASQIKEFLKENLVKYNITKREKEIIFLISEGQQNKEIAYKLNLAVRTVDNYIYNIFRKFKCQNRTELLSKLQS